MSIDSFGLLFFIGYLILSYVLVLSSRRILPKLGYYSGIDPIEGVPTLIGSLLGIVIAAIIYHLIK